MSAESLAAKQARVKKIISVLDGEYPEARCTLDFRTAHELLVAAIMAAQCTDEKVNQVTPALFEKYPTPAAFAEADITDLETMIRPTGFFRNKSKAIIESARQIVSNFGGEVPSTIEELTKLSGVGRKTANLIVGVVYGQPAVIVDTHVTRISARLGLTVEKDPSKIEADLRKVLAPEDMTRFNHLIVSLGRDVCKAPTPKCGICRLVDLCPHVRTEKSLNLA